MHPQSLYFSTLVLAWTEARKMTYSDFGAGSRRDSRLPTPDTSAARRLARFTRGVYRRPNDLFGRVVRTQAVYQTLRSIGHLISQMDAAEPDCGAEVTGFLDLRCRVGWNFIVSSLSFSLFFVCYCG